MQINGATSSGISGDSAADPAAPLGLAPKAPHTNCSLSVLVVLASDPAIPISVAVMAANPQLLIMRRFVANLMYVVGKLASYKSKSTDGPDPVKPEQPASGPAPIIIVQVRRGSSRNKRQLHGALE